MVHTDDLLCLENLLMGLKSNTRGKGRRYGMTLMIFTGDVHQIMPIVKGVDPLGPEQAAKCFFFEPSGANLCDRVTLTINMRLAPGNAEFRRFQRNVGLDAYPHVRFPNSAHSTRYIPVPSKFARTDEDVFIREVFNETILNGDRMALTKRVLLAPINSIVNRLNERVIGMMPSNRQTKTYLSTNVPDGYNLADPNNALFASDHLQSINSPKVLYSRAVIPRN